MWLSDRLHVPMRLGSTYIRLVSLYRCSFVLLLFLPFLVISPGCVIYRLFNVLLHLPCHVVGFPFVVAEELLLHTIRCPKVEVMVACQLWERRRKRWSGGCVISVTYQR